MRATVAATSSPHNRLDAVDLPIDQTAAAIVRQAEDKTAAAARAQAIVQREREAEAKRQADAEARRRSLETKQNK
jgi:hypothetical protein